MILTTCALLVLQGDLLPTNPTWQHVGDQAWEFYGTKAENAGDVNGDGYPDLIVLAPGAPAVAGVHGRGRAELYLGSANGYATQASWSVRGGMGVSDDLDWHAIGIGDVNGDQVDDLAFAGRHSSSVNDGKVYVFYGEQLVGPNGGVDCLVTDADWVLDEPSAFADGLGEGLLGVGDLTGDGFGDLLVGCPGYSNGQINEGLVLLFEGGPLGLAGGPVADFSDAYWSAESNTATSYLGRDLFAIGDVDGDQQADFAARSAGGPMDVPLLGRHFLFTNVAGGTYQDATTAAWDSIAGHGQALSNELTAADFNLDGYSDIVVSIPNAFVEGVRDPVFLYNGGPSGLTQAPWYLEGGWASGTGTSVASGDFDADGHPDLALIQSGWVGPNGQTGRVQVYRGRGATAYNPIERWPSWEFELSTPNFGQYATVGTLPDIQGDGAPLLVAELRATVNGDPARGQVSLFARPTTPIDTCPFARPDWSFEDSSASGGFNQQIANIDGDAYDDLVMTGVMNQGDFLQIFRGSATGLEPNPTWTIVNTDPNLIYGMTMLARGDVNGDGYDDILVRGDPRSYFPPNLSTYHSPRCYLFYGSPLGGAFGWTAAPVTTDPIYFGLTGTLADVNGDGYDDVVIGAPGHERCPWSWIGDPYDLPGAVYVYYGGVNGPLNGNPGTELNADWSATDGDSSGRFGLRIRNAGDLDADPLDPSEELLIAAPFVRDSTGAYAGALYMWRGSMGAGLNGGSPGTPGNAPWKKLGVDCNNCMAGVYFDAGQDVTGDGIPDLALRRIGSGFMMEGIDLLAGDSTGFPASTAFLPVVGAFELVPDFDGDGVGELVWGLGSQKVRAPGNGLVNMVRGGAELTSGLVRWRAAGEKPRVFLRQPHLPSYGDVNGDGKTDLCLRSKWYQVLESEQRSRLTVYYGTPRALIELSSTTVTAGDRISIGYLGGDPNEFCTFGPRRPLLSGGSGPSLGQFQFASGTTDATGCWLGSWVVPRWLPIGTYPVRVTQPGSTPPHSTKWVNIVVQ